MDYTALKTEIQADPLALGYAAYVTAGNDIAIASLLNALTGPGAATIAIKSLSRGAVIRGIIPGNDQIATGLDTSGAPITQTTKDKWAARFAALRAGDERINLDANMMGMLGQLVTDKIMTQPYIDAFTKRTGSRAEVLWGEGTTIMHEDVRKALRG